MDQVKRLLSSLSARQIVTILIAAALVGGGVFGLVKWQRETGFRTLFTALAPEDASLVIAKLKEGGVPYRISADSSTISVPEEKVAELRLEMAGAGLPKSGRIGFEIFDKTNFGMTDFAEKIQYRRALEGELERSVMTLAEVEQARVHVSFPQESVFLESRQPAKASVLVRLRMGMKMTETSIPAITHLISSAVEGLNPEQVSVLDMRGNLLSRPKRSGTAGTENSEAALEYRQKVEHDLVSKLESTLEPLIGAGRYRTAVSAECDITSGEQSEETYDPKNSVMLTSQTTEDVSSPSRISAGIPGTATNLPDSAPKPAAVGGGVSRKTENISYQTNRTVKRTVLPQGAVKRLSVSVLIDHEVRFEGTGAGAKRVLTPPDPERIKKIHDLVTAAVGLKPDRGDQLIVEALPFESTLNLEPPAVAPVAPKPTGFARFKDDPKMMWIVIGAAAVVVLAFFFIVYKALANATPRMEVRKPEALPPPSQAALPEPAEKPEAWTPSALPAQARALAPPSGEALVNQVRDVATRDAEVAVGVLRGWLREEHG